MHRPQVLIDKGQVIHSDPQTDAMLKTALEAIQQHMRDKVESVEQPK